MKLPRKRKPIPPAPGNPSGVIGKFEIKQTATRVGYTGLGMVLMAIKMVADFSNETNVGTMLTHGGYFGGFALMAVGFCVVVAKRLTNNTGKKL